MEQEHLHDPLRFQYESNTRTFSLQTRIVAVLLVLIFVFTPLYEISPETFRFNAIEIAYGGCFPFGSIF
ncbi:hypothetical protein U8527_10265 [Kordia algicida OT-1]|nr:hypothetical protein [Kordia algicida]